MDRDRLSAADECLVADVAARLDGHSVPRFEAAPDGSWTRIIHPEYVVETHAHRIIVHGNVLSCNYVYGDGVACGARFYWSGTSGVWAMRVYKPEMRRNVEPR